MKNIKKYILAILLGSAIFLPSCDLDKGNYEYTDVSDIKIDTLGAGMTKTLSFNPELGTTLNVKLHVTYTDTTKLKYYWVIYPYTYVPVQVGNSLVYPDADTIGRKKNLNWIVDAAAGSYYMQMVAQDSTTGLKTFFSLYVTIPTKGSKSGLYIASEYDGMTDIDVFGSSRALIIGGDHFEPKYYSSLHGGEMIKGKPKFISYGKSYYYIFTDQEGKRLNTNSLALMDDFNAMFYNAPAYNPQKVMYTNNCEFILNDGKMHVMYTSKANDRKFSAPIAGTYNAYPFLSNMTRTTYRPVTGAIGADQILFDQNTNAFRPYFPQSTEVASFKTTVPGAFVNANNMGTKPVAIFEGNGGKTYSIIHNSGHDSLVVTCFYNVVDDGDLSIGGNSRICLDGCEGISSAKYFASSQAGSAFFYATDKAVYSFSYTSGQTKQVDIYKCASNEEVTCLYQMPSGGFPTAGCVLWIALWDSSTKKGTLREYEVDPTSGTIRTYWTPMFAPNLSNPSITTGFGKIKDMIIKM